MRKVGTTIAIVVLILILVVAVFAATFNVNQYRATIQSQLEKHLNRTVLLGDMHLGIFPPLLQIKDLAIAEDSILNNAKPFVETREVDVSVKLLPLLRKSVQISSITLQRPSIELVKDMQGRWNFSTIGTPQKAAPSKDNEEFHLGELTVQDGQIAVTDQQAGKVRTVYDHINLTLTGFAPSTPFSIAASVHLPGQGAEEIRLQGTGGPMQQAEPARTPFHGSLDLKGISIAGLQKFFETPSLLDSDGILSGHANIASQSGTFSAVGEMAVDQLRVRGSEVGYPVTAEYEVNDDVTSNLLRINKGAIKLGQTPLYVTGTINMKSKLAQLDGNLKANSVSIAEISRLAAVAGIALAPGTTTDWKCQCRHPGSGNNG